MRHLLRANCMGQVDSISLQKIAYSKTKSDTLAKLDGTYKQPEPAAKQQAALQRSVFDGPPAITTSTADPALRSLPPASLQPPNGDSGAGIGGSPLNAASPASQGVKRPREESENGDEDEEEAPMDMDDEAMDEGDSDED